MKRPTLKTILEDIDDFTSDDRKLMVVLIHTWILSKVDNEEEKNKILNEMKLEYRDL